MDDSVPYRIPVDNVARVFIPSFSIEETTFSRIAVRLKDDVDRTRLQEVLEKVILRFPYFQVYLESGLFGYVLRRTDDIPSVIADQGKPNRYSNLLQKCLMFRVKAGGNTVAVETSHILTDGFGTMSFLATLLSEYMKAGGSDVGSSALIKRLDQPVPGEEWRCAFRVNFLKNKPYRRLPPPAYHPHAEPLSAEKYHTTKIVMDLESLRSKSSGLGVTVNDYLTAVYASALQELYFKDLKAGRVRKGTPVRLGIPADLRRRYPSACMRNFSYPYTPLFYPSGKRLDFVELAELISNAVNDERRTGTVESKIARNLRIEDNFLFRICPGAVRRAGFKFGYRILGRQLYSGVITNLGEIILPEGLAEQVDMIEILPSNTRYPGRNTAVHSFRGKLVMEVGSSCRDRRLENELEAEFAELGIDIETETADY